MKTALLTPLQETVKGLSERIVAAQRPIMVLDAVKWPQAVKEDFFARQFKVLPKVTKALYDATPLPFDPSEKRKEFYAIERDISKHLGNREGAGLIMQKTCEEYRLVIDMLLARGTPLFYDMAKALYGSANDRFYEGSPMLSDLSEALSGALQQLSIETHSEKDIKKYSAFEAAEILNARLKQYFFHQEDRVAVIEDNDIVADAAAGANKIKMRKNAMFSERDLRLLEVHEGWVHVGTSINGNNQPVCTFLGKGAPSSVITQEGLAVITEIFTFSSYPERIKRITNRIKAIDMAEKGADFLEVFHYFYESSTNAEEAYTIATRIFRGSTPSFGPFTKDLSYAKGFILIYNYIRLAIQAGLGHQIITLFAGKIRLADMKILSQLMDEGMVTVPRYLPNEFKDLSALGSWMCFSLFLNQLDLKKLNTLYQNIL